MAGRMPVGNDARGRAVVHEVAFTTRNPAHLFVDLSAEAGCRLELAEMLPRGDGRYGQFFVVREADPTAVRERASERDSVEAYLHHERPEGGLLEFADGRGCPALTLAELGALPREVRGVRGRGRIVAEVPAQTDATPVIEAFLAEYPESELAAKREKDRVRPLLADAAFRRAADRRLTDRQWEVLAAAYEAGYYDWPRETTGAEVAADLGISSSTFSQHVQAAERNLLGFLFEDSP